MPQSISNILVHLVFSTKNREPNIGDDIRDKLHAYMNGIIKNQKGILLKAGSVTDHVHLSIIHPRTCSSSDLVKAIKMGSTKWLKAYSPLYQRFHWQNGYGIFSISPTHLTALETYILNQAKHHRRTSFQEEYRHLMRQYHLQWDERYVWD
ncbi:MAG: IS200/IS605 family transposase [Pseudomonadota bacterium]|nr:IS200/IS605 family transposase [Gammaproteobacteria bacterium]MBU1926726.1 IS200/IS605 family transposase [Gammaproteobacteria bacterium]MBU2545778.1 IS200/IS605 family transposase [Gammaproteobacteria bacterium]